MRPAGKARRPRILSVVEGGATPPGGLQGLANAGRLAPRAAKLVRIAAFVAGVASAVPVAAQTAPSPESQWFLGGTGGAAVVQNVGGAFGGEIGARLTPRLDVFGEVLDATDTATRRRIGTAMDVATALQASQGVPATGTVKAPAALFMGGLRYVIHESGNLRFFVQGEGGVARVTFQPSFTLAGADITSQLAQFGVTLGADLAGTATKAAFGGGFGVQLQRGVWYVGGQIGVVSIRTPSQASNVIQATATLGRWF
jgi:hypothetical protein